MHLLRAALVILFGVAWMAASAGVSAKPTEQPPQAACFDKPFRINVVYDAEGHYVSFMSCHANEELLGTSHHWCDNGKQFDWNPGDKLAQLALKLCGPAEAEGKLAVLRKPRS